MNHLGSRPARVAAAALVRSLGTAVGRTAGSGHTADSGHTTGSGHTSSFSRIIGFGRSLGRSFNYFQVVGNPRNSGRNSALRLDRRTLAVAAGSNFGRIRHFLLGRRRLGPRGAPRTYP